MSAFLGPIHHWLYRKIQMQESMVQDILLTNRQNSWDLDLEQKMDAACQKPPLGSLEDVIDKSNIHGWLQDSISIVEMRYAFVVARLLEQDPARIEDLKQTAYHFGREHPIANDANLAQAYQAFIDSFLEGMPCDHANMIEDQDEDRIVWKQNLCVHTKYWDAVGGDISVFYELRAQMLNGMLKESGLVYKPLGNKRFSIGKEFAECFA